MTTDITELAQSLKAEDVSPERMEWLKKLADMEYCASNPGHWLMSLKETNYLAVVALQCLEKNLALVEALGKAQQQMTESENRVRKQNRHICELFDDNTALRQRIAGLEARTVKLPDLRQIVSGDRYVWSDGVYNYSQDVKVALAIAGIKVEVE
ncbi:hypothetical protein [Klebsiella pneumoniae]|uniref:hypothetical protein n=1 Tax=Klebsiella pneumoniae TaxID=573 RepID=UPI00384B1792